MSLRTYRHKRAFDVTPEPRGDGKALRRGGHAFVIQKHAATRLHHDFRLEWDDVLLSWAVPKGPPSEPGAKVLAVRTEDHPLAYASFEGVIPKGQYGAGTVMLWDRGTWTPDGDPRRGLAAGKLDFTLQGERLRGRWSLVRMSGTARGEPGKENWLLIKRSDRTAEARAVAPQLDRSVATGRSMEQIAAGRAAAIEAREPDTPPKSRRSKPAHAAEAQAKKQPKRQRTASRRASFAKAASALDRAQRAPQPGKLAPQLATLVSKPPDGDEWLHEVKFDGYRLIAWKDEGKVRLRTRTGQDWTARFPTIAAAIGSLPVSRAIVDGEVVVLSPAGVSQFQALQNWLDRPGPQKLVYFVFDLPYCEGFDLTRSPLRERKTLLERLLPPPAARGVLRYSEHVVGHGPVFFAEACSLGLEGSIAKRADAPYQHRRTRTWLKAKCLQRQEFVVGGWTRPEGSREHFGALMVGVYDEGKLRHAGKVGTGFTATSLAQLMQILQRLATDEPPFVDPPRGAEARRAHWVRPECVVEIVFTEWTADGHLRHPSFQGLREDKDPRTIRRERPAKAPASMEP